MKKLFAIIFILITFCTVQDIQAKGVIIYNEGPKFEIREALPDSAVIDGKHVNVGIAYEQFGLFWLPVWNYGTCQYALVTDDKETAWPLDDKNMEYIKKEYNIEFPDNPSPSLWNQIGLKPVVAIFLLLMLLGILGYIKDLLFPSKADQQ